MIFFALLVLCAGATGETFLKMGSLPTEFMLMPSVNTPQTSKRVPIRILAGWLIHGEIKHMVDR